MPEGSPSESSVDTHLLGFMPDGLLFSVFQMGPETSFAAGSKTQCDGYLLSRDDQWRRLGTLHIGTDDLWKCNFPKPWRELGLDVVPGTVRQSVRGTPDP